MAFALCPLLTDGAIEALLTAGSDELKVTYLDKLVSGEWTGTMNLTEPQAGSDLAAVRSRAEPQPDGTYKVFGTKIYITWGDHDLTPNTIHMVLARIDGAPPGVRGISMFIVPKVMIWATWSLVRSGSCSASFSFVLAESVVSPFAIPRVAASM